MQVNPKVQLLYRHDAPIFESLGEQIFETGRQLKCMGSIVSEQLPRRPAPCLRRDIGICLQACLKLG